MSKQLNMIKKKICVPILCISFMVVFAAFRSVEPNSVKSSQIGSHSETTDQTDKFRITLAPGKITLTNNTSGSIFLLNMILSFNLEQTSGISTALGLPWLSWKPTEFNNPRKGIFQFMNTHNLPGGLLGLGQSITFEYIPDPWNNPATPVNVTLATVNQSYVDARIFATVEQNSVQTRVIIKNTSSEPYDLTGAIVSFGYSGPGVGSPWSSPWLGWIVEQTTNDVVLKASYNSSGMLAPESTLIIGFSGSGPVSDIRLRVLTPDPIDALN